MNWLNYECNADINKYRKTIIDLVLTGEGNRAIVSPYN